MILTSAMITDIRDYINDTLSRAYYTQSGIKYDATNYHTELEGSIIKIRVYLDESVSGTITEVGLERIGGQEWIKQVETFEKPSDRGFYKLISIDIREVVQ